MKRLLFIPVICVGACLGACTATLESPSKALAFSNPQASMSKSIFGTKVEIGTNATGAADITYDPKTGFFHLNGNFASDASGVVNAEAERAKIAMPLALLNSDNQTKINMASIQAQQQVWEAGFETIGSVGGTFLARPAGASAGGSAGLLASVLPILTGAGIKPDDIIKALKPDN